MKSAFYRVKNEDIVHCSNLDRDGFRQIHFTQDTLSMDEYRSRIGGGSSLGGQLNSDTTITLRLMMMMMIMVMKMANEL